MRQSYYLWAAVERIAPQFVTFGVSIVIARLVGPEAYGLVGMLAIFMALGQAFSELGLSAAIIQRKTISDDDLMSVFVVNVIAGTVITLICCAISPLVASFYGQKILTPLLCTQSLIFAVSSFGVVQSALVSRNMLFRLNAKVEIVSCLIASTVGLALAFSNMGVWSLVGMSVTRSIAQVGLLWQFRVWCPRGRFSKSAFESIWAYSSRLLYASLFHRLVTNAYSVIIGKVYSPTALGIYTRAFSLQQLPVDIIGGIVQRVAFPLFSKHQDDKVYLHQTLRKQVRIILAVVISGLSVLYAISGEFIPWLLGESWSDVIPLLRTLCFAGVFTCIFPLHSNLTKSLGDSKLFFRIEMVKKVYILIMLVMVYRLGLQVLAWGMVSVSIFDYLVSSWPSRRYIDYRFRQHMEDLFPTIFACALPTALVCQIVWVQTWNPLLVMVLKSFLILSSFSLFVWTFRKSYFRDIWEILQIQCIARIRRAAFNRT